MDVSLFDFPLPPELIAQKPSQKRQESRLLVVSKEREEFVQARFCDLPRFLSPGDLLVVNNTRVEPVKLIGKRENGVSVEFLLVQPLGDGLFSTLCKGPRRFREGEEISFGGGYRGKMEGWQDPEHRMIRFPEESVKPLLAGFGLAPLPPYIHRDDPEGEREYDRERYQTVYARSGFSIAAPTAGLHFTPELLRELEERGVERAEVTLNVGEATFQPLRVERVEDHKMKKEWAEVGEETAQRVEKALREGRRVLAVGTTSVRTLESFTGADGLLKRGKMATDLFIYPGYRFKAVSGMITNFHLPKSTLMMLISAMAGTEKVQKAYGYAIKEGYRFFSYGDAMLIL